MTEQSNSNPEETYLAKFAETSPAAITRVDKNGRITYANSRAEEVLGLEESETTNSTYDDPVWKVTDFEGNEFPADKLPFSIVQSTEESVEDVRHAIEWPDGRRKLLSINASPLFDDEGEFDGTLSIIEDITDRVREKRDLERSRDRYQNFFDKSGEAIYVLKMGGENHGEILEANPQSEDQTGYSREELIGMNMVEDLSIEIVDMDMEGANRKLNAGKTITFTDKKKRKDGSVYWTEVVVTPLKYEDRQANLSINRDITERKQAEKRKDHLNSTLKSIRNVNQLLVKEDERDELIEGICDILVDTRDYHNVWIALFEESGELATTAESGLGNDFEPMRDLLDNGEFPHRVRKTLENEGAIVTDNPPVNCDDCPLSGNYEGRSSITVRIEYGGRVFGMISASVPEKFVYEKGERHLFEEVAGDIAFGLHDIEVEKRRREANEKLRKSEKQFKRAIQYAPFPMMIHAEDGQVVAINDTWLEITGYEREDIPTVSAWTKKAYGEARNDVLEHIERLYQQEGRIDEGEFEFTTKNGDKRVWDFSSAPIGESLDGRRLVLSIADDVTDRKRMEKRVQEERDRAEKYLDIAGSIIILIDEKGKVAEINRKGCEILGYDRDEILGKDWFENFIPERLRETVIEESRKPLMAGTIEEAEYYENPILTKDGEERVIVWENTVVREDGEIVGHLSSGIDITERKRMEKRIQEERRKLRRSFIELAETTSRVLGVRDPYTQAHELRVGELAREVGRRMGLEKEELLGLYLGGVLHDIGKIAIPETILTKPGELKDVEWEMIKSHPKVGYNQILKDTDFPWAVAEITLHHHERLDGSGYPDGLTGEELSREVRILAAVDVVEAMSTRRPYRKARSKETTLNVIKDGKGDEFDPEVVEVLVEMIDEGEIEFGE